MNRQSERREAMKVARGSLLVACCAICLLAPLAHSSTNQQKGSKGKPSQQQTVQRAMHQRVGIIESVDPARQSFTLKPRQAGQIQVQRARQTKPPAGSHLAFLVTGKTRIERVVARPSRVQQQPYGQGKPHGGKKQRHYTREQAAQQAGPKLTPAGGKEKGPKSQAQKPKRQHRAGKFEAEPAADVAPPAPRPEEAAEQTAGHQQSAQRKPQQGKPKKKPAPRPAPPVQKHKPKQPINPNFKLLASGQLVQVYYYTAKGRKVAVRVRILKGPKPPAGKQRQAVKLAP